MIGKKKSTNPQNTINRWVKRKTVGTKAERDIEKYLVLKMKDIGAIAYKWDSPNRVGVPDRICVCPCGILIFVEVKTKGGTLSHVQKREHTRLRNLGHRVEVLWNEAEVDSLIIEIKLDMEMLGGIKL